MDRRACTCSFGQVRKERREDEVIHGSEKKGEERIACVRN